MMPWRTTVYTRVQGLIKNLGHPLQFHFFKVALMADIEKAFLMISMAEIDQDPRQFLWVNDIVKDPPDIHIHYSYILDIIKPIFAQHNDLVSPEAVLEFSPRSY